MDVEKVLVDLTDALRIGPEGDDWLAAIAILNKALDQRAEEAWQPIETAPQDGNAILLTDGETVQESYWTVEAEDQFWCASCGQSYFDGDPTHWQPLPEPPAQAIEKGSHRG